MFALGIACIVVWPTDMPVWAFFLALAIGTQLLQSLHFCSLTMCPLCSRRVCHPNWNAGGTDEHANTTQVRRPLHTCVPWCQFFRSVITELVIGYVVPGKPVAMMLFKTYGSYAHYTVMASTYSSHATGYISASQGLAFARDLKLGHYLKVPPRSMFWAQVVATVVAGTAQLGVQIWLFAKVEKFCDDDQADRFICPRWVAFTQRSSHT